MRWNRWFDPRTHVPNRKPRADVSPWNRRAFLGGAAAMIGLPFLESMVSREARGAVQPIPTRLVWWFVPCGMMMDDWTPNNTGAGYDLPTILQPLAPVQSQVSVLTRLANRAASVPVAGDHARGTGSFLTCRTVEHTAESDLIQNGISVDQVAAQAAGQDTVLPSLELGTSGGSAVGDCDSGYSCAYSRNISWSDEITPRAKIVDARLAFDRLFAGYDTELSQEDIDRRLRWRTSVLDTVTTEANDLHRQLSRTDQDKLDQYLTGIRELEKRIQQGAANECLPGEPPSRDLDYAALVSAMNGVMVKALECDMTRFITFMMENGGSYRSFDFLGVQGAHHELSHHQGDANNIASLNTIARWEIEQYVDLVSQLQAVTERDGSSLLDHTLVMLSSEISDGDWHNHDDLPVLLAGSGGGAHRPGRHIDFGTETPIADLYLSMLQAVGVTPGTFGQDGTRALDLT